MKKGTAITLGVVVALTATILVRRIFMTEVTRYSEDDFSSLEKLIAAGFTPDEAAKLVELRKKVFEEEKKNAEKITRRLFFYRKLFREGKLNEVDVSQPTTMRMTGIRKYLREKRNSTNES